MFNNISNIIESENLNEKSLRNLPEDLDHMIFDEEILEKENKNTLNLQCPQDHPNPTKKRDFRCNFESFFPKTEEISLNNGLSFRTKVFSNNIDHYELENLLTTYQESSNSFTPPPINKTTKESPKSMNDISYLKPKEFFSNQTFIVPLLKKPNNKESFRILSSKDAKKKGLTCEPDKISEILTTTNEIKGVKQPFVQNKTSYMNIAKKITAFNEKTLKKINTPLTFHFEKPEKATTYTEILRKTFNKDPSISNFSNKENIVKEKFATIMRKPQISARNKTQEKKPLNNLNNMIHHPISSKRIPTETFNDNKLSLTASNNLHKGISAKLPIPTLKMGQMSFLNVNLVKKEGENTIETSSSLNIYDKNSIYEYKFEKTLGQGSYATVKLAFEKSTGKKYAIKIYEKYRLTDHHRMNNVRREISILKKIDHKNIIKLFYALDEKRQIFLITEYIGAMSLHAYLKAKPFRKLEEREAKKLFFQIVQALDYCHSKNIVHRDIKLENILLDEKMTIKIIDFGFSIIIPSNKKLNIFCGTPSYMAPEIVNKMMYNGHATDVWALGILLYVMLHGNFPFKGLDDKDLFRRIAKGRFEINENLSKESKGLLMMILKVNPNERVSTHQILQNSWFF